MCVPEIATARACNDATKYGPYTMQDIFVTDVHEIAATVSKEGA